MSIRRVKSHPTVYLFILLTVFGVGFASTYFFPPKRLSLANSKELAEQTQNYIPLEVLLHASAHKKPPITFFTSLQKSKNSVGSVRVPILMYHYVEYVKDKGDTIRISLNTPPYTLEEEIKTLSEAGYTFMTNDELFQVMNGDRPLPARPILLTFDDGYRDFYTDAYPILKKYHAKATQYVIAGFLNQPNNLLTSQLKEIAADGLVEIGAHTMYHPSLKGLPKEVVHDEVFQSKAVLEDIIGKPVVSFAYPYGAFDLQAIRMVRAAGFHSAVSTVSGIDQPQENRYFLYRLRSGGRSGEALLSWLQETKNSAKALSFK